MKTNIVQSWGTHGDIRSHRTFYQFEESLSVNRWDVDEVVFDTLGCETASLSLAGCRELAALLLRFADEPGFGLAEEAAHE